MGITGYLFILIQSWFKYTLWKYRAHSFVTIAGKTEGRDNERVRVSVGEYRDRVNETERKIETARVLAHCTALTLRLLQRLHSTIQ